MRRYIMLYAVLAMGAAVVIMWPPKQAQAQSASAHETCIVTATTTSTDVASLVGTAGCVKLNGCVKLKTLGATSVCVGGETGTTGDPASPAAGNKCYPLPQNNEYPTIAPPSRTTLRVQTGTSLVAVASMNGC